MIWIIHWNLEKVCLANFFLHFFQHCFFFGFYVFFQFFLMNFITSKIIFSKFGYKNRFWGHFSWFLGRDINSTVWTRNGSKIKNKVLVFKGLISYDELKWLPKIFSFKWLPKIFSFDQLLIFFLQNWLLPEALLL